MTAAKHSSRYKTTMRLGLMIGRKGYYMTTPAEKETAAVKTQ